MRASRVIPGLAALAAIGLAGGAALAWRPAIAPIAPPPHAAFAPESVARGAELAAIGDCSVCHGTGLGRAYAGGHGLPTPFGTVYVTNITPDPDTGIGRWSEAAFRRAMRDGIGRSGRHLYPALPYPHFTRASDEDIGALYAFLMTRAPVHATTPPNRLPFPLNVRATVAGWNLLFLRPGPWQPDPGQSAEWNRGAYLVEAVGHCGACHSPHNALGAEENGRALAGGVAEGWTAHGLAWDSPARRPWTVDQLDDYLRTGMASQHGAAAGPMTAVTAELGAVPPADVRAIAVYIASRMPHGTPAAEPAADKPTQNAVFDGACAGCHAADAPMTRGGAPSLALSSTVNAPTPRNAVDVVLHGLPWREGTAAPYMPGFGDTLSDAQVADVVGYLRARYGNGPAWTDIAAEVHRARTAGGS